MSDVKREEFGEHREGDEAAGIVGWESGGTGRDMYGDPCDFVMVRGERTDTIERLKSEGWRPSCYASSPHQHKLIMGRPTGEEAPVKAPSFDEIRDVFDRVRRIDFPALAAQALEPSTGHAVWGLWRALEQMRKRDSSFVYGYNNDSPPCPWDERPWAPRKP